MSYTWLTRWPTLDRLCRERTTLEWSILALAVAVPLGFVLYTGQIWEDFFITYRHSENLVEGRGLVFTAGERVHGFTSVLNTLLPALFAWISGARDFTVPLLLYRLVSLVSLVTGVAAILHLVTHETETPLRHRWLAALFPLFVVLEIKITAFTMNGQEAGLMVGFLALLFVLACQEWPRERVGLGGLCIAGLLYTRPDAFVYVGIIGLGSLVFARGSRRAAAGAFVRSGLIGVGLFLPWLIFAHFYYGSFIPHTIVAKNGTLSLAHSLPGLATQILQDVKERLCGVLSAIYDYQRDEPGAWPHWLHALAMILEGAAVTYWLVPTGDRIGRLASFCALLMLGYLAYAALIAYSCPWYYPPTAFFSLLALSRLITALPGRWPGRAGQGLALALLAALLLVLGYVFGYSLRGLRMKQEIVDWGHRRPLGLWLKEHVADHETVYLEPIGYIGYFSQRILRDWPGLVSPEVVAARQRVGHPANPWGDYLWGPTAADLQPDWIIARPSEEPQIRAAPALRDRYRLVKVFNVAEPLAAAGEFPGSFITYNDAVFLVFRRQDAGTR